jgi:hypothetical protein
MIDEKNSSKANPFVIKIFCADGDPNGIRIINKSNWSGQGLVFPRYLFEDAKNNPDYKSMFEAPGVYVLIGNSHEDAEDYSNEIAEAEDENSDEDAEDDDLQLIYVGEGDPVRDRLDAHDSDKDKDFWNSCVFFIGVDLNKAHIQYLEASLLKIAKDVPTVNLINKNKPTFPNLSLPEKAIADGFLTEMLSIFPLVSVNAFQKIKPPENLLYIIKEAKGICAKGYETQGGFLVLQGSTTSIFTTGRSLNKLKKRLTNEGILSAEINHLVFVKDHLFPTPARAAGVVLGFPAARSSWKRENEMIPGELQEQENGDPNVEHEGLELIRGFSKI